MRLDMYVRKHHAKLQIVPTVSRVDVSGGQMKVDGDGLQNKSDSSLVPAKRLAKLTNIRGRRKELQVSDAFADAPAWFPP
jgi:hypothetical protein